MLIGYARISSDHDGSTFDLQRDALLKEGIDPRQIFTDVRSGARADRPGLQAALEYATTGDTLIVWKLDRLGRSLAHLIATMQTLEQRGIGFRSLTEQIDTTTTAGRLMFHLLGALAEFERGLIRERICAGLEAARKRGRRGGRPEAIQPETLAAIHEALAHDTSKAAVCRIFGVKRSTLYDALARSQSHATS